MINYTPVDSSQPLINEADLLVQTVIHGTIKLDGGAMFGPVPKTLWCKLIEPDQDNRITLTMRGLYIRAGAKHILVDIGAGDWWEEKRSKIFSFALFNPLVGVVDESQVTDVIASHLHFDHAGGLIKRENSGALVPRFPNATLHLQRENLSAANTPHRREKASYIPEIATVIQQYTLNLVDGAQELFPAISVTPTNGHTRGQQTVHICGLSQKITFASDVIPTRHHLHPAYHMGYDMHAELGLEEKEKLLMSSLKECSLIAFPHDPDFAVMRVNDKQGNYSPLD